MTDTPSLSLLKIDPPNSKRYLKIPAVDWHAKCMAESPEASIIEFGLAPCSKVYLTFFVFLVTLLAVNEQFDCACC